MVPAAAAVELCFDEKIYDCYPLGLIQHNSGLASRIFNSTQHLTPLTLAALLVPAVCFAPALPCHCTRLRRLNRPSTFIRVLQQDIGDSGYLAYTNARVFNPSTAKTPAAKLSYTPENAEATASSQFAGIHRMTAPVDRRTYATVQVCGGHAHGDVFGGDTPTHYQPAGVGPLQ